MKETTNIHGTDEGNLTPVLPGFVYFIRAGDAIKIGFSQSPNARKNELQTGNPEKLQILAIVPTSVLQEHEAHAQFDELRIRGEWFQATPELLQYIEKMKPPPPGPGPMPSDSRRFKSWADAECVRWPVSLMVEAAKAWGANGESSQRIQEFSESYEAWRGQSAVMKNET